jgi:hypothetical protein
VAGQYIVQHCHACKQQGQGQVLELLPVDQPKLKKLQLAAWRLPGGPRTRGLLIQQGSGKQGARQLGGVVARQTAQPLVE